MAAVRFPEFRESLENTKYPFVPTATLDNGQVVFLEGTFLDAHIYPIDGFGRYFLSRVVVASTEVTLYVGDLQMPQRLSAVLSSPTSLQTVQLLDVDGRPGGVLVADSSRLSIFSGWGPGTYDFTREQTEFAVTCSLLTPDPGVTGIRPVGSTAATGRVWLLGDDGVILDTATEVSADGREREIIIVHAVGDPLYLQKLCEPENIFTPVNPIRAIRVVAANGSYTCYPDTRGNFNLQANDGLTPNPALRVRTTRDGIVIRLEGSSST